MWSTDYQERTEFVVGISRLIFEVTSEIHFVTGTIKSIHWIKIPIVNLKYLIQINKEDQNYG